MRAGPQSSLVQELSWLAWTPVCLPPGGLGARSPGFRPQLSHPCPHTITATLRDPRPPLGLSFSMTQAQSHQSGGGSPPLGLPYPSSGRALSPRVLRAVWPHVPSWALRPIHHPHLTEEEMGHKVKPLAAQGHREWKCRAPSSDPDKHSTYRLLPQDSHQTLSGQLFSVQMWPLREGTCPRSHSKHRKDKGGSWASQTSPSGGDSGTA